jgi:Mrp family chromosome partitioning ATPase/capsular polysaccharide biosynthesis protein
MEPIDYVRALIRRWPIVAVGAFIGAFFAFLGTDSRPPPPTSTYAATNTLLVTQPIQLGQQQPVGTITFAQVPVFATTGEVPRRVAQQLGYQGVPASLAAQVKVDGDPQTGTLRFTSEQTDPAQAVRIADAFSDETVRYLTQRQQDLRQQRQAQALQDVDELEAQIRQLDQAIAQQLAAQSAARKPTDPPAQADSITEAQRDSAVREYSVAYESYRSLAQEDEGDLNLTTLERAQPVKVQTGGFNAPRTRSTRVPIGAAIGALLGAAVALLAERLDVRIRDRRRAEESFQAGVVAELPAMNRKQRAARLVVGPAEHHAVAEAFRSLRTSIAFMATGGRPNDDVRIGAVLITSPSPAEGKTTIAVNLAAAFAETGRRVVIVNADFRRPAVSSLVTDEPPALPGGVEAIDRLDPEQFLVPTRIPGVELLDLGPLGGAPGDLPRATIRLVAALRERVDVLIVDTPPLAITAEALEFIPLSTVVLLVARAGRTATTAASRAGELVRFGGAPQVAVALTGVVPGRRRRVTYYEYYGGRRGRSPAAATAAEPGAEAEPGDETGDEWREIDEFVDRESAETTDAGPDDDLSRAHRSGPP